MSDGKTPQDPKDTAADDAGKTTPPASAPEPETSASTDEPRTPKTRESGADAPAAPESPRTTEPATPIPDTAAPDASGLQQAVAADAAAPDVEASANDKSSSDSRESAAASGDTAPRRGRGLWLAVAVFALLLTLAAAYLWQQRPAPAENSSAPTAGDRAPVENLIPAATLADIDALRDEIRALNTNVGELSTALDAANATLARQARDFERLKDGIEARVDLLDSLPGRVENAEDALVTLQGISAGSRNAWLLAEAEYYMQIANAQVQLANNPALAATALELADQRVRELGDPAYTPVRRAMAGEIAALRAVSGNDIEGVTLTLGSLASMVPTLPLINEIDVPAGKATDAAADGLTGWARMKASMRAALSGLVRIRQSDERVTAMLSPEAEYFLRLNLQLQLQAARLSLLLSETAGYRQSLQDASGWLREYFDRDHPAVQNALEMIDDIAATQVVSERPDVSGSLRLLRQQRTVEAIAE